MMTCGDCPYWIMSYCELVEPCPVVGAELQRGFMVAHYRWYIAKDCDDTCPIIEMYKQELARVKGEVPCPECTGMGGEGIRTDIKHPCFEAGMLKGDVEDCDTFTAEDCLHLEHGGSWETCNSGYKHPCLFKPCSACQGAGKKYPEGTS